jgi:putative addiction module component (TIGR02574 family)
MTREATELLEKALRLPPKARAALIASLIDSLDGSSDEDAEVAWQAEIDRRARALDRANPQPRDRTYQSSTRGLPDRGRYKAVRRSPGPRAA